LRVKRGRNYHARVVLRERRYQILRPPAARRPDKLTAPRPLPALYVVQPNIVGTLQHRLCRPLAVPVKKADEGVRAD
jgi:hypothetical protein